MKNNKLTNIQNDFIEIYSRNSCNISHSCRACNITRTTYYNWMKKPSFKSAIDDCVEGEKDWVESQMKLRMKGIPIVEDGIIVGWKVPPSDTMLIWWSKSKMRDRGYSEKDTNATDNTITINHKFVDGIEDEIDMSI